LSLSKDPTASIWFEIWGAWFRVRQISIFKNKFPKNFDFSKELISIFSGKLTRNFDFSRHIDENFDFSKQIDEKFRFFSGKDFRMTFFTPLGLLQNVRFSRQNYLPCHLGPTAKLYANYSISLEKYHFRTYFL